MPLNHRHVVPKTMAAAKKSAGKGAALWKRYGKIKTPSLKRKTSLRGSMPASKNSLVRNINKRKKAGTSRSKKKTTITKKAYSDMEKGWSTEKKPGKKSKRKKKA